MVEKIKKLLESPIGEDQLIGLSLGLANNVDFREVLLPNEVGNQDPDYMLNNIGKVGYISIENYYVLLGMKSLRRMDLEYGLKFLNRNKQYLEIKKEFFNPKTEEE